MLDDECPYYGDEAAARAAQQRLKDRGSPTVIDRVGAIWVVTRHDAIFADLAAAYRAVDVATA